MERNHLIDSLKFLCALLVVFIHCEYPYKSSIIPITDIAVPLFFAISGYFVYGTMTWEKRIIRFSKILLCVSILYLLKTEVYCYYSTSEIWIPTSKNIIDFFLFNDVAFSLHLWYLPAYIYVLVIAYIIDIKGLWRISQWFILPLLLTNVIIKYNIAGICPCEVQYYRNAFFLGLPYFLMGALLRESYHKISKWRNKLRILLPVFIVILLILRYYIVGYSLMILIMKEIDLLLLTWTIFLSSIIFTQTRGNIISNIGCRYAIYIYIFHVLIMQACEVMAMQLPESIRLIYMYINPFVVFLLSIVITYFMDKLRILKL